MQSNELEYLNLYYDYLKNQITHLLPGEGARILTMTNDIIHYINQTRNNNVIPNATTVVFDIADAILKHNNSLINQMVSGLFDKTTISIFFFRTASDSSAASRQQPNRLVERYSG